MSVPQGFIFFRYAFIWVLIASTLSTFAIGVRELWTSTNSSSIPFTAIDDHGDLLHIQAETVTNTVAHKLSGKSGLPIWRRSLPFQFPRIPRVVIDPQGDTYVMGRSSETHLVKLNGESGSVAWQKSYSLSNAFGQRFVVNGNDVLILAATQNRTHDYCNVRKYSALDGALLWEEELHQVNASSAEVAVGTNGDVGIGLIKNNNFHVVKLSSANGSLLWSSTLAQTNRADSVNQLTSDSQGNVFLAADGFGIMYMAKLAAEDGSLIWERYHSEVSDSESRGTIIQMDNGDLVTWAWVWFQRDGQRQNGVYVARYRGTDGSLLWKRRFEPALPRVSLGLNPPGMIKTSDDHLAFLSITLSVSAEPDILQIHEIDSVTGETLLEWMVPETDWPDAFTISSDRLALTYGLKTSFFHIGPELQPRLVDDQLEISWEPSNLGWQLDSSTLDLTSWNALPGSTATNIIRVNRDEPSRFFRLFREN